MSALTSLLSNSTAADTQRLVEERSALLTTYTSSIDAISVEADRLRACIAALEKSNSIVVEVLTAQQKGQLSSQQISEMLRKLTCVLTTDLPQLSKDLQQIRQNNAVLRELVLKMRELKTRSAAALQYLESVADMDEKIIADLTELRGKAVLPLTCHNASTLL